MIIGFHTKFGENRLTVREVFTFLCKFQNGGRRPSYIMNFEITVIPAFSEHRLIYLFLSARFSSPFCADRSDIWLRYMNYCEVNNKEYATSVLSQYSLLTRYVLRQKRQLTEILGETVEQYKLRNCLMWLTDISQMMTMCCAVLCCNLLHSNTVDTLCQ